MKRTILTIAAIAAAVLSITGCATASRARSVSVGFADFRPYISSGFWISTGEYNGRFEPIGELSIRVTPAYEWRSTGAADGIYQNSAFLGTPANIRV